MSKKVMIIGGTGLLGHHSALEFLKRGYRVSALAHPEEEGLEGFPAQIGLRHADIFTMESKDLEELLRGFDILVYAIGPDDRSIPPAPAKDFFGQKLVATSARVFRAARTAGVRRAILLGSYFVHFHCQRPELRLAQRHAYIQARLQQEEELRKLAEEPYPMQYSMHDELQDKKHDEQHDVPGGGLPELKVVILQLPYIFGFLPGRIPLWREVFLDRFRRMPVVFYPRGGSAMTCTSRVAEAVCNSVDQEWEAGSYPLVEENMQWKEMFALMYGALGLKLRFAYIPWWLAAPAGWYIRWREQLRGKEGGLHYGHVFRDILSRDFHLEPDEHIRGTDPGACRLREAIEATARACYPED